MSGGISGRLGPVGGSGLGQDVAYVAGYGVEGDDQFYGYLQVGLVSGDETQHVYFALCQAKAISLLDESLVIAIELGLRPLTGVPAWSTGNF